jgi:hypothetical protein
MHTPRHNIYIHLIRHGDYIKGLTTEESLQGQIFSFPKRRDRRWGPRNLLSGGNNGYFSAFKMAGAWSWTVAFILRLD